MRKLLLTLQYYLCLLVALLTASLSYAQNDKKTFQISGNVLHTTCFRLALVL